MILSILAVHLRIVAYFGLDLGLSTGWVGRKRRMIKASALTLTLVNFIGSDFLTE